MRTRKRYYLKTPGRIIIAALALVVVFAFLRILKLGAVWRLLFGGKAYSNADFGIDDYISSVDRDSDGVDDQTDILKGARAYVATKPYYESKYYSGGYPDDEYGVCTDVVAQALLNAGYDLRELVDEDIRRHPDDYAYDCGDKNIDFRRVRNLLIYFRHTAISLTTDISEYAEWQGGDIVVFEGHIGIISDKRNSNGTPYLIHHGGSNGAGSLRPDYEEDILELCGTVLGHFRIS